jgi:hypothetical protein
VHPSQEHEREIIRCRPANNEKNYVRHHVKMRHLDMPKSTLYFLGVVHENPECRNVTEYGGTSRNITEYGGLSRNMAEYYYYYYYYYLKIF